MTWSKDEAVGLMQEAGIVGAGGAGFPTYVKYQSPPRTLLVNGCDSEPGYYADKLLMRDEPEALVDVFEFLNDVFSIDTTIVAAEDVARPYMAELERLAKETQEFSVAYVEPKYKFGQEKALMGAVLGMQVPKDDLPPEHGVVVSNNESLFNVYRAVFRDRPVITKFLHVYGEAWPPKVYEAPIGTLAEDLLEIHGTDLADFADCRLYDGGPILADRVSERLGDDALVPVTKTTNAFLVVHPDKDKPRVKHYPKPGHDHNTIDKDYAPTEIINIEAKVDRVRVPLTVKIGQPAHLVVAEGDTLEARQVLAEPAPGELSVGVHASIAGTITAITEAYVEITR